MTQPTDATDGVWTAVFFCNVEFDDNKSHRPREVARLDHERMEPILTSLGFRWRLCENQTIEDTRQIIKEEAAGVPENSKGFLCIFSTHGGSYDVGGKNHGIEDTVVAKDGHVLLKDLMQDFYEGNVSGHLANKPKVFLMQCCRGGKMPATVEVSTFPDPLEEIKLDVKELNLDPAHAGIYQRLPYNLPIRRDILVHYATVGGYMSWKKDGVGTPFLQAWCKQLEKLTKKDIPKPDIITMATAVNREVCEDYQSRNTKKELYHGRHQMPQIVSMFTDNFYF